MHIVAALREGYNNTNKRTEAFLEGLNGAHKVTRIARAEAAVGCDLLVQTGFNATRALRSQIDQGLPYLIMEAPFFRKDDIETFSSWGYNGLQGGAWRPPAPSLERPKPELKDMHDGPQLIIGQKPTDHSLRGSDHVAWILEKRLALPEAHFRPHPLMVPQQSLRPIELVLQDYGEVHIYSSTVGVDALLAGCRVYADSECALFGAPGGDDRDRSEVLHGLSWGQSSHALYHELTGHILDGYDEARSRAASGLCETPRGKMNGQEVTQRYHNAGLSRADGEGA